MTAQEYIQQQLDKLINKPDHTYSGNDLEGEITRLVLSKKFRKTSISEENIAHVKNAIATNLQKNEPIKLTLVFGGYKLWRLEEHPNPDWAELFSIMYYTKWVKPICDIYEPGVWFDFYSDDAAIPYLNNVSRKSTEVYCSEFACLLDFITFYQPDNLKMTINRVLNQYESEEDFVKELKDKERQLADSLPGGYPVVSNKAKATLEMNVKLNEKQKKDKLWKEKVLLLHDAYASVSKRRPYYRAEDKIMVFTTPYPDSLSVGTTKDSVVKFWVGVGVLRPRNEKFRQLVLSSSQLEAAKYRTEEVSIKGIDKANFQRIRVVQ